MKSERQMETGETAQFATSQEDIMGKPKAVAAKFGEKMIELKIYLWTNNIAKKKGKVIPKHAWSAGVVRLEPNEAHGIVSRRPKTFHTLLDLGTTIQNVLMQQGIILHPGRRMRKYVQDRKRQE